MEVATVGRQTDGLRFEQVQRDSKGEIDTVVVRLRVPGLDASRRVWETAAGFNALVAFFNELAADWRGWQGERRYESAEQDLLLAATHDGHVHLFVQLREKGELTDWSATAVVQLDPGEETTKAAADVAT